MSPRRHSALALTLLAATVLLAGCAKRTADNSPMRKEQIIAHLTALYPSIADAQPALSDIIVFADTLDVATMALHGSRGQTTQTLFITPDNTQLYIASEGPIDVSKPVGSLRADQAAARRARATQIKSVAAGMPSRGKPEAPVTIVEFSDFQCPYCASGAQTMGQVVTQFPNEVQFIFMHYPLPGHDWARHASLAALCAGQQSSPAHWHMHDQFFAQQATINDANVAQKASEIARGARMDMTRWRTCVEDELEPAHQRAVALLAKAQALGDQLGVDGTPSFFINGEQAHGAVPFDMMAGLIREALAAPH